MKLKQASVAVFYLALIIINVEYNLYGFEHLVVLALSVLCPFAIDRANIYREKFETLIIGYFCILEMLKLLIIPYLAANGMLCSPVSIKDIETIQMTGLITIGVIVILCINTVIIGINDVQKYCSVVKDVELFEHNYVIEESITACIGICVAAVANVLVVSVIYNIGLGAGMLVYIYALALVGIAYIIGITSVIRKRKEELIEAARETVSGGVVEDGNSIEGRDSNRP